MPTIKKIGNSACEVDLDGNKISFLDNRFYLTKTGTYLPSVTTILTAYPKSYGFYQWLKENGEDSDDIRDAAGRQGSTVHALSERYDNGEEVSVFDENGGIQYTMNEWSMFEKYIDFRNRYPCEILNNEMELYSEKLGCAGTLDRIIDLKGKKILVDIKTSNNIYNSFWLQLAAYRAMVEEPYQDQKYIDDVAILWLQAKTRTEGKKDSIQGIGWQLIFRGDEAAKDWELFKATQQLWLAENGSMRPRHLSYCITHKRIKKNGDAEH
jgi:hypothetical protein